MKVISRQELLDGIIFLPHSWWGEFSCPRRTSGWSPEARMTVSHSPATETSGSLLTIWTLWNIGSVIYFFAAVKLWLNQTLVGHGFEYGPRRRLLDVRVRWRHSKRARLRKISIFEDLQWNAERLWRMCFALVPLSTRNISYILKLALKTIRVAYYWHYVYLLPWFNYQSWEFSSKKTCQLFAVNQCASLLSPISFMYKNFDDERRVS